MGCLPMLGGVKLGFILDLVRLGEVRFENYIYQFGAPEKGQVGAFNLFCVRTPTPKKCDL